MFVGELNYCITLRLIENDDEGVEKLMYEYWERGPKNYQTVNDIVGAYCCACLEYERRTGKVTSSATCDLLGWFYDKIVAPYEDDKIKENGDVYPRK